MASSVGLGDESSYLSNSALSGYGRYMTDEDDENSEGLTVVTDNYSLDALKVSCFPVSLLKGINFIVDTYSVLLSIILE